MHNLLNRISIFSALIFACLAIYIMIMACAIGCDAPYDPNSADARAGETYDNSTGEYRFLTDEELQIKMKAQAAALELKLKNEAAQKKIADEKANNEFWLKWQNRGMWAISASILAYAAAKILATMLSLPFNPAVLLTPAIAGGADVIISMIMGGIQPYMKWAGPALGIGLAGFVIFEIRKHGGVDALFGIRGKKVISGVLPV